MGRDAVIYPPNELHAAMGLLIDHLRIYAVYRCKLCETVSTTGRTVSGTTPLHYERNFDEIPASAGVSGSSSLMSQTCSRTLAQEDHQPNVWIHTPQMSSPLVDKT